MFPLLKMAGAITIVCAIVGGITLQLQVEAKVANKEVKSTWTSETIKKRDKLVSIGMPKDIATSLVTHCKKTAKDPVNCIKIGSSILGAESSLGKRCHNNNCVGMNDGGVAYKSTDEGIAAWVGKYNKYWYKQKTPSSFYSVGKPPITRYCMGKKRDGVCKEGFKNSWATFNKLSNLK